MSKLVKINSEIVVASAPGAFEKLLESNTALQAAGIKMIDSGSLFMNRRDWSRGEWDNEPDRVEWRSGGVPCLVVRGPRGAWSGYVGVASNKSQGWVEANSQVHGGITYAGWCDDQGDELWPPVIQLTRQPGEPKRVWWVGFDCGHMYDATPSDAKTERFMTELLKGRTITRPPTEYRNLAYAIAEVEKMAVVARKIGK